jgi:hypothetical protein
MATHGLEKSRQTLETCRQKEVAAAADQVLLKAFAGRYLDSRLLEPVIAQMSRP